MNISFEGLQNAVVTFQEDAVTAGYPVAMSSAGTVSNAAAGVAPVGVALNVRGGCAAVQVKGYAVLGYSGTAPGLGWTALTADGSGGVKTPGSTDKGRDFLVVQVDSTEKTVGLFL